VLSCTEARGKIKSPTNKDVCGISKIGKSRTCYNAIKMDHDDSAIVCSAGGVRLCTVAELEADVMKNSGCKAGEHSHHRRSWLT
jgi:hypothetical protein